MKYIPLTQGKVALVDDEDYEYLNQWKWTYCINKRDGHEFVVRRLYPSNKAVYMNRLIMSAPSHLEVDHADQNPLNNQKYNLRLATRSQNAANMKIRKHNKSGYKGVDWKRDKGKWRATITVMGVHKHLGYFDDKLKAAKAYDDAAKQTFGEFAQLNVKQNNVRVLDSKR